MERILNVIHKLIKADKTVIADLVQILLTGNKEEKVMTTALMALVKANASKAIQAFVVHYLDTDKNNVDKFIDSCEMFGLPERACVDLLKLKNIDPDKSDDDSESEDLEDDIMKTLKSIIGD